jgi:hypothetical protein
LLPKIYHFDLPQPSGLFFQEMDCDLNDMGDDTTKEKLEEDMKTRDEKARN